MAICEKHARGYINVCSECVIEKQQSEKKSMNHIQRLQADLQTTTDKLAAMKEEIAAFRVHLASPKFQNTDKAQNDWIATSDVNRWLDNIQNAE